MAATLRGIEWKKLPGKIVEVGDFGRAFLLQKAFDIWGIDTIFIFIHEMSSFTSIPKPVE